MSEPDAQGAGVEGGGEAHPGDEVTGGSELRAVAGWRAKNVRNWPRRRRFTTFILRAAGDSALARHLARQVGRTLSGLVERPGRALAEVFTEIAFAGEAEVGQIAALHLTGHDGLRMFAPTLVMEEA